MVTPMKVAAWKEARGYTDKDGRAQVRAWLHRRAQSRASKYVAAAVMVTACKEARGYSDEGGCVQGRLWLQCE